MTKRNGFTLIEVLIAVAISSIVFLSVISTYSLTLRTLGNWKQREDDYYIARNIFRKMRSEISSVYFISDSRVISASEEKTDYKGLEGNETTFSFYTSSKSLYFPFTCLMKITYKFVAEGEEKGLLIREEKPIVNFQTEEDKISRAYVYSGNLRDFKFKYSDGKEWSDSWSIEQSSQTLKIIKIEFISSNEETFSTAIYLPTEI